MVYSCKHFRREMQGVPVRRDIYVSVAGTDLVRLPDGQFAVLEDNLRVPSGVSLHADQPPGDQARVPAALHQLRRPAGRSLRAGAARDAADAGAGAPARPDDRAAHARRLQLGLLRAHVPGPPDGHRAGRGPRPVRPRQRRLHADDRRSAARGRDLPARGRRLHRSAGVPARIHSWACRACSTPTAPATSR